MTQSQQYVEQPVKSLERWYDERLKDYRPGVTTAEGDQQWPTDNQQQPAAWKIKDPVLAVWALTPDAVAPHSLIIRTTSL